MLASRYKSELVRSSFLASGALNGLVRSSFLASMSLVRSSFEGTTGALLRSSFKGRTGTWGDLFFSFFRVPLCGT